MEYDITNLGEKYRPRSFDDIIGQDRSIRSSALAATKKNPSPFYIYFGNSGCGKTTTARVFAQTLNCLNPGVSEKTGFSIPCGECDPCRAIMTSSSGVERYLWEFDGAQHSKVEESRDVVRRLRTSVGGNRWRVFLGDEIHRLSPGAFDVWLRHIEKPPARNIIIFCTTNINKIPNTIVNRAANNGHYFGVISLPLIAERIMHICDVESYDVEEEKVNEMAEASAGSMRRAIKILEDSLVDDEVKFEKGDLYNELNPSSVISVFNNLFLGNKEKVYWEIMKEWIGKGLSVGDVVNVMLQHLTSMSLPFTLKYHGWQSQNINDLKRQVSKFGEGAILVMKNALFSFSEFMRYNYMGNKEYVGLLLTSLILDLSSYRARGGHSSSGSPSGNSISSSRSQPARDRPVNPFMSDPEMAGNLEWFSKEFIGGTYRFAGAITIIKSPKGKQLDIVEKASQAKNDFYILSNDFRKVAAYAKENKDTHTPADLVDEGYIKERV